MLITPHLARQGSTSPTTCVSRGQNDKSDASSNSFARTSAMSVRRSMSAELRQKSRDFHWYSPVLTPQLQDCLADVVVQPRTEADIAAVVAAAVKHRIPLTVRGGGTGNYGQSVPLKGGVLDRHDRFQQGHGGGAGQHSRAGRDGDRRRARSGAGIGPATDDVSVDHAIGHDRRLSRRRLCGHRLGSSRHHSRFRDDPVAQSHDHRRDADGF